MKDIKTREHDRKPKVLEKASRMPKELAKEAGLAAKEKSLQGSRVSDAADHPDSPTGYAGDKVESVLKRGAKESGRMATGFVTVDGKTYFLKDDGRMLTEAAEFVPDANGALSLKK